MSDAPAFRETCPHCGAIGTRRLGDCSVCSRPTCERCGNVHFASGARVVTHRSCLKQSGDHFSMIKIVR